MQSQYSCFSKIGLQGGTGCGKSFTSLMLALGISVTCCDRAPVLVWDSEPAWQFYRPMFEAEGVTLIHDVNRSFKSLTNSLTRARREGACVHVVDQLAVAWRDLLNSFSDDSGFIGMSRQNQLRGLWDEFVLEWKDLPIHSLVNGRVGWEFEEYEEDGHRKFAKGDTKMRAGGSESFGYEPFLTCEFTRKQETEVEQGKRRKRVRHLCTVIKDQTSILNGEIFEFVDMKGYKPGDYKRVFREFLPHFEFLQKISGAPLPRENSKELVHNESYWQRTDRERKALLEEWDASMENIAGGRTRDAETIRRVVGEAITKVRSRTRFEQFDVRDIERCVLELMAVEEMVKEDNDKLTTDEARLKNMVLLAQARLYRGEKKSILEMTLEDSIKAVRA